MVSAKMVSTLPVVLPVVLPDLATRSLMELLPTSMTATVSVVGILLEKAVGDYERESGFSVG